ncbi:MAG: hypothetical protein M9909_12695 [Thermomicrobiales bacterium]|nr:hypothetical protein [Thermomicrobiales bacterium]
MHKITTAGTHGNTRIRHGTTFMTRGDHAVLVYTRFAQRGDTDHLDRLA